MMAMRRDHELHFRRRGRNIGVLVALIALAVLLFAVTVVKMGQGPGTLGNPSAGQAGGWGAEAMIEPFRSEKAD